MNWFDCMKAAERRRRNELIVALVCIAAFALILLALAYLNAKGS